MTTDPARPPYVPPSGSGSQARELEALNEVARIATLDLELQPMLQRITDSLASRFDWQLVALVIADAETGNFVCQAVTSTVPTEVRVGYSRPLGTGVVGEVAATQQPLVIDDTRLHANFVDTTPGVLSEICVPIKHQDEVVAVLNIESTALAAFAGRLPLLHTIAEQIGGAIASARRYEELKHRAGLMEMMSEISREALLATNLDEFLRRVVTYVYGRFPLAIVSIRLFDAEKKEYVRAADAGLRTETTGSRWPITAGIIGRCLRENRTQIVRDVSADPDYIRTDDGVVSELVVPIRFREEILGVFNAESQSAETFTPATVLAFEAFANQIAGALRLLRTHDELALARQNLQRSNEQLTGLVEKFERISAHDGLTGLHNRLHFDNVYTVEWRRSARARTPLALLIADIDHFKDYNDARGHRAGDECLKSVAAAIAGSIHRAGDVVVRFGGEEFAILLPNTDLESARVVAETIRRRIAAGNQVTISIGAAACIPDPDESKAGGLVDAADKALYAAKRRGRNRVVCSD
jgi:diguanylate cyclase (GGDEF)-like protein